MKTRKIENAMKQYRFYYIDAFTDIPFYGNPCAVFPDADGLDDATMQLIARETNLNETAFVFPGAQQHNDDDMRDRADFAVRYFTPTAEIPFAGHPTIATAFLLAILDRISPESTKGTSKQMEVNTEPGDSRSDTLRGVDNTQNVVRVRFGFKVGVLPVEVHFLDGKPTQVGMAQKPPVFGQSIESTEIAPLIGAGSDTLLEGVPAQVVDTGVPFLMVAAKHCKHVIAAEMDRAALRRLLEEIGADGLFLFSPEGYTEQGHTYARLLNPNGTSEDPFTGSASGCMGCYLYSRGVITDPTITLEQGHHLGRPGTGTLVLSGTPEHITQVQLYGSAATTFTGSLER